ncbi:DUF6603 domain-containing protein [Streptomyces sp. NPDC020412]|uniref:DUF6603 domain-containing protein n=1 Tax=Streptomyces sp. NPDC020412 TaxID=3365073 RepID=UPI0037A26992
MSPSKKNTRLWVLLADLNVKNLSLSLPLISALAPTGSGMGLESVEMGYASATLTMQQRSTLQALLPSGTRLPDQAIQKGGFLQADLTAGGKPHLFYVPLTTTKKKAKKQKAKNKASPSGSPALLDANTSGVVWWESGQSAGPVNLDRIGVGYGDGSVLLLADASVRAGGLLLETRGLGVAVPLSGTHVPAFRLDGLGLGYDRAPLTIAGEFLKLEKAGYSLAVGGAAVVSTPVVSLTAMGYYAQRTGSADPSLFVFGMLDLKEKALGPPCFRVTRLAAGFGYHTLVRTPAIKEVASFPFVRMLDEPGSQETLGVLDDILGRSGHPAWVEPHPGRMWLAAGLHAVVYELVDVSAVAVVQFGDDLCLGLYGRASAQFPRKPASAWASVGLDVSAEYRSSTDTLAVDVAVSDGSFILDRNCRLTGSAAVRVWFGGSAHPGDFVITVGGYHPRYQRPRHYPDAERLGIDWNVGGGITVSGGCYAALTPHAFMAGFKATAHGEWGPANLDVSVYADALIQWDPLYFDLDFGGSVRGSVGPFSAEVHADGQVWGPPVGGHARVSILGFGIDVDFGSDRRDSANALSAGEFRKRMLPGGEESAGDSKVVQVAALGGLLPGARPAAGTGGKGGSGDEVWAVGSDGFTVAVTTAVPATGVRVNGRDTDAKLTGDLHIRPMQRAKTAESYSSGLDVTVLRDGKPVPVDPKLPHAWTATASRHAVPAALWGRREDGDLPADTLIGGYATGVTLAQPVSEHADPKHLSDEVWNKEIFPVEVPKELPPPAYPSTAGGDILTRLGLDLRSAATRATRGGILAELKALKIPGLATPPDDALDVFSAQPDDYLDAVPRVPATN